MVSACENILDAVTVRVDMKSLLKPLPETLVRVAMNGCLVVGTPIGSLDKKIIGFEAIRGLVH